MHPHVSLVDFFLSSSFYVCVCEYRCIWTTAHVWSEDNFQESVLSFHTAGSRDQAQIIRVAQKSPLPTELS